MKKTLKLKIFASFMLLTAMLAVAGTISIVEFRRLSNSVHDLIQDNYRSIEASKHMMQALEREDSGILLLLLGKWDAGREIIESADSLFQSALRMAENNLTEQDEEAYILRIKTTYEDYKAAWRRPIVDTDKEGNIVWYENEMHQLFLNARKSVDDLMTLNQATLYNEASILREESKRAIMPGLVSIIAALVFSLLLNFFITRYFVRPITELAGAVNKYREGESSLASEVNSNDEIKDLENAINNLILRLKTQSEHLAK